MDIEKSIIIIMKEDMNENVLRSLCKVYFPQLAFVLLLNVDQTFVFSQKFFFIMLQVQMATP